MTGDIKTNDGKSGQTFFNFSEGQAPLPLPDPVWPGHGGGYAYYLGTYQPINKTCSNIYFSHHVPDITCVYLTPTYDNDGTMNQLPHAHMHIQEKPVHVLHHFTRIAWNKLMHAMNGNKKNGLLELSQGSPRLFKLPYIEDNRD